MGGSLWDNMAYCRLCGTMLLGQRESNVCGSCAGRFPNLRLIDRAREPEPEPEPEMFAVEKLDLLIAALRTWRAESQATTELWEGTVHIGFKVASPSLLVPRIYYVHKNVFVSGPFVKSDLTSHFDSVEPPKAAEPPTPKKSAWEWIRKPGV